MPHKKKLRRIISAAAAAALISTGTAAAAGLGDANGDGLLGVQDINTLANFITGRSDKITADADMNSDGIINVYDMVLMRRAVMKNGVSDGNYIQLKGTSITTTGSNMELTADNIVTITASGTYYVSGTLNDGQIIVNVPDETVDAETVKIFLNGANITGATAPAIHVVNAENTSINLVEGTVNSLSDGDTAYADDSLDMAVLQADDDMTIKGDGVLNITANTQNAVECKNDLKLNGGDLNITTVLGDAVRGKKSVTVKGGNINIDSAGDGIKSTKGSVAISGGTIISEAENDAVQSETTMTISGSAELYAYAKRSLTAGADYTVDITSGSVVATSHEAFTNTDGITVDSMLLNYTEKINKQEISIKKDGKEVCSVTPGKKYMYALISNAALTDGTYNVYTGGVQMTHEAAAVSGEFAKSGTVGIYDSVAAAGGTSTPVTGDNAVTLSSSGITFSGTGAEVSADSKTITISQPGVYTVKGEMEGGQIVVDVDKTAYADAAVELSLEGMSLTNTLTSPIYIASVDDKCTITAKSGTVNTISDGTAAYTNADEDSGAIYSKDDLNFKGKGTLIVNGNYQDAIVSKNDIKIKNGTLKVTAVDDGIRGKDSVTIGDAADTDFSSLNVIVKTSEGDGIKSTATDAATDKKTYGIVTINGGTIDIDSYADGIQAEQEFVMNGGDLDIYTYQGSAYSGTGSSSGSTNPWGGGMQGGMQEGNTNKTDISAKGIKAVGLYDTSGTTWQSGGNITINGGNITIDSSDDSIHCGGNIAVNGGVFKLASADDAMHSDHDLTLGAKGGQPSDFEIYISKCYEGIEAMNIYQHSGTVLVKSDDDGYNAAGGADGSGNTSPGGWNQGGGFGGPGNTSSGSYKLEITGGVAIVQSSNGDHDAFDSNGSLTISGGCVIANGQEPFDCDGTLSTTGGTVISASSQGSSIPANTLFTVADSSNNVIISFKTMQAMGSVTTKHSDVTVKCYTGGTVSGGTNLITTNSSQEVYTNGTISGGTEVSQSSSGGGQQNPRGM
ncbi:MAG: carbohydrate-binding domain-containing protein [Clostridium sp.]|nr:carbohydrate-binding domain-containing protein [Clostridium sp.]MCM1547301.1 carbohydrate-binding domain-containing protein [Ruminococcus sp.]